VITYDEHGGCYDHVPPPAGAVPPQASSGSTSPVRRPCPGGARLAADRAGDGVPRSRGGTPLDHTSILKTVQQRCGLPSLTARDAAAPGFGDVLTLAAPRADDVLAGVIVPVSAAPSPAAGLPSHLQQVQADLISRQYPAGQHDTANALAAHGTPAAHETYIRSHAPPPC